MIRNTGSISYDTQNTKHKMNLEKYIEQLEREALNLNIKKTRKINVLNLLKNYTKNVKDIDYEELINQSKSIDVIPSISLEIESLFLEKYKKIKNLDNETKKLLNEKSCFNISCLGRYFVFFVSIIIFLRLLLQYFMMKKNNKNIVKNMFILNDNNFNLYIDNNPDIIDKLKQEYLNINNEDLTTEQFKETNYFNIYKSILLKNNGLCIEKNIRNDKCNKYLYQFKIFDDEYNVHNITNSFNNEKEYNDFKDSIEKKKYY